MHLRSAEEHTRVRSCYVCPFSTGVHCLAKRIRVQQAVYNDQVHEDCPLKGQPITVTVSLGDVKGWTPRGIRDDGYVAEKGE